MTRENLLLEQLENNNTEQTVALRLNKNKIRELELRAYLDQQVKYGLNRKDTILRMFETLKENGLLDIESGSISVEVKAKEDNKIETVELDSKANLDMLDD